MSLIVKIKEVFFYTGLTEGAGDCFKALKLLKDADVPYTLLQYSDQEHQHKANFDALNTWTFGHEAKGGTYQKKFKDYPIVTWRECHDDFEVVLHVSHGLKELKDSSLLANKDKVERK